MKKIAFVIFSIVGLFIALTVQKGVQASATDEAIIYGVAVELTENVDLDYNQVANIGDFKIEFHIDNNPGFTGSGIGLYYDKDNFEPIVNPDSPLICCCTIATDEGGSVFRSVSPSIMVNTKKGRFGLTTNGLVDCESNGLFFTVYLRRKQNAPNPNANPSIGTLVSQFYDSHNDDLDYEEPTPYVSPSSISTPVTVTRYAYLQYMLGDLNGDGYVNMMDANIISSILGTSASINATVAEDRASALTGYTLDGLFHNGYNAYEGVFIFDVIDVNGDGDVSDADRAQISNFVMAGILGLEPEDLGCASGIGDIDYYLYSYTETITPAP